MEDEVDIIYFSAYYLSWAYASAYNDIKLSDVQIAEEEKGE